MARSKARRLAQLISANNTLSDSEISASEVTGLHDIATTGDYGDLVNVPATFPPHDHTRDSHSNVTITSVSASQFLKWDGSAWVNDDIPQINSLDDISDVTITSASTDQFLKWNGSAWVNDDIPQINSVGDISNVTITAAATGDFLRYNGTAWVDSTIQNSDISSSAVTQHLGAYATTSYVDTEVANIVSSAPATLDTLNELAAALGDDPNFATTISNQIGTKLDASELSTITHSGDSVTLTGAVTGSTTVASDGSISIATTATSDPTLTLSGDASGSATFTNLGNATLNVTVANDSHTHDTRYTLKNEFDWRGTNNLTSTTTSALKTELLARDVFDSNVSAFKTGWSYAGNGDLTDAGRLTELAGTSWLTWTDNSADNTQGNFTALVIAPNTGGSAGKMFVYNDQGSGYAPGWREIWTNTSDGSGSGLDADLLDGIQASSFLRSDANDTMTGVLTVDNEFKITAPSATTHFNYQNGGTNYIRGTTYMDGTFDLNNNTITDVGTLYVNNTIQGQGDVAIGGGSGYGYFKGYTLNWNHFITSRARVTGSRTSPTITGGHDLTLIEYLNTDDSGFWFKSSHTSSYTNIFHIGPSYTRIYSGRLKLEGTGRIEGIDTVSSGTDAANKNYVDTQVASSGASMASLYTYI